MNKRANSGSFVKGQSPYNKGGNFLHQDLSGRRYGRWTVLHENGKRRYGKHTIEYIWLCKCDCGTERNVRGCGLRSGKSTSCGCLNKEILSSKLLPDDLSFKRRLFRDYQRNAMNRNYTFALSFNEFVVFLKDNCFYCGAPPLQKSTSDYSSPNFTYNGIDRIDNTLGYELSNSVSCCGTCNRIKADMDVDYFLRLIKSIYERHCK